MRADSAKASSHVGCLAEATRAETSIEWRRVGSDSLACLFSDCYPCHHWSESLNVQRSTFNVRRSTVDVNW
ncbi:hypothetical protein BD626DRAFT_491303 [Schizophyllum amplum]|uniref:Uncharacterized protein n=1 Tax=Schizophyllum amplum TaxID=97359 RepID=A0A550CHJ3_9AGAR|nr:hypothetical protein BD626DRAFT_491303 [Auriculariopsis ampla]